MFLNYELSLNGYKTVYLGESVPVEDLKQIKTYFNNITFITYSTVEPSGSEINSYIKNLNDNVINDNTTQLYLFGRNTEFIANSLLNDKVKIFDSISGFTDTI